MGKQNSIACGELRALVLGRVAEALKDAGKKSKSEEAKNWHLRAAE